MRNYQNVTVFITDTEFVYKIRNWIGYNTQEVESWQEKLFNELQI